MTYILVTHLTICLPINARLNFYLIHHSKSVIADFANNSMQRMSPWHADLNALKGVLRTPGHRFMSSHITANHVSPVFTDIFPHEQVRLAALRASTSYLTSSNLHQLAQLLSLFYPMLDAHSSGTISNQQELHLPPHG